MICDWCNEEIKDESYELRSLRFCHAYHGFLYAKSETELGDKSWEQLAVKVQKELLAGDYKKPLGARSRALDIGLPNAAKKRI